MQEVIWVAPPIIKPEFRLYYDDNGKVLFYTCEKPEGKYIEIDAATFAEARPDLLVIDGKLIKTNVTGVVGILTLSDDEGTRTTKEDASIVVDDDYSGETNKWKITYYEL